MLIVPAPSRSKTLMKLSMSSSGKSLVETLRTLRTNSLNSAASKEPLLSLSYIAKMFLGSIPTTAFFNLPCMRSASMGAILAALALAFGFFFVTVFVLTTRPKASADIISFGASFFSCGASCGLFSSFFSCGASFFSSSSSSTACALALPSCAACEASETFCLLPPLLSSDIAPVLGSGAFSCEAFCSRSSSESLVGSSLSLISSESSDSSASLESLGGAF
mmetsp:Transcript_124635/g.228716  ORF Transcript_124635/g.228716 Transcript_124635/m.228716 type:complete len:221 (+) Transcript_124635:3872-4534(+)